MCTTWKQDESVWAESNLIKLHPVRLPLHHTLHNLFERVASSSRSAPPPLFLPLFSSIPEKGTLLPFHIQSTYQSASMTKEEGHCVGVFHMPPADHRRLTPTGNENTRYSERTTLFITISPYCNVCTPVSHSGEVYLIFAD